MLNAPNKHVIGINATDVPHTTDEDVIINIGYCGGYKMPVGAIVEPSFVINANTLDIIRIDSAFDKVSSAVCVTADSFVTEPISDATCVYDMELFKLAQLPHKRIHSLKIVSDNLNEKQCEAYVGAETWNFVQEIINKYLERNNEII